MFHFWPLCLGRTDFMPLARHAPLGFKTLGKNKTTTTTKKPLCFCGPGLQGFRGLGNSKFLIPRVHPNGWVAFHKPSPVSQSFTLACCEGRAVRKKKQTPNLPIKATILTYSKKSLKARVRSCRRLLVKQGTVYDFNIHTFQAVVFQAFLPSQT